MERGTPLHWVLEKTPKGRDEIASRGHALAPSVRSLLILADGHRTAAELIGTHPDAARMQEGLQQLLREGYLQAHAPGHRQDGGEAQASPRSRLRALVREMFGPHPKLAQKFDLVDGQEPDLDQAVFDCAKYIRLFIDAAQADAFVARAAALLAPSDPR